MKAASILVLTMLVWAVAHKRTDKYWALATVKNTGSDASVGNAGVTPSPALPSLTPPPVMQPNIPQLTVDAAALGLAVKVVN